MKLKIVNNPNSEEYKEISQDVMNNDGFCPCMTARNQDTKCICKEFKEQNYAGYCKCGRFMKIEVN
jgi:hypothetical protein